MKTITDLFIKRPVLAVVVNLIIIIAGLQAIMTLSVRQYPRSESAKVTVSTVYVGANADLVRGFITTPLERVVAAADGIDYMESTSTQGMSTITAHLKLNYDSTKALAEIGSKVDQVRGDLPPEAEVPIINVESADSEFAAAYLSFDSSILKPNEITEYLVRVVQPRLSALAGVQKADILGGRTFAMRIWLAPEKMASLNISPAQVRQALGANNYLSAIGRTKGSLIQVNLTANTDISTVDEFENLVVRRGEGTLVRLRDIAKVELGAEDYESEVRFSGKRAVFMGVWALPNANVLDVMKLVHEEMEHIQKELPSGLTGTIAYDSTEYVNDAIHEVTKTLTETLLIVAIVIFLFLGSLRSVLVPLVAIPVSLIGAIFLMQMFGFTVNLLTLLAIVLSVGLVVDDAIVMVENVERHLREGQTPIQAAILGARELISPVISMTITLAAVYLPIGLQGGLTGSLFREFAFTLSGAVIISGVVALTLSPVMSSRLLRAGAAEHGLSGVINRVFEWIKDCYTAILDLTLSVRPAIYILWIFLSLACVPLFMLSNKELAPTEDQGFIMGIFDAPANATIDQTAQYAEAVNKVFFSVPEAAHTFQITMPNNGFGGVALKPWGERKRTGFEILPQMNGGLMAIPGIQPFAVMPPALPGGGQMPIEFVLLSTAEPREILEFAEQIKAKGMADNLFAFPPIIDTKIDQPQVEVILDRDKVAYLGMDMQQVGADLSAMMGGNYVNRFNIAGRSYKVIPQIQRADRLTPDQLKHVYVTGPSGTVVPLNSIASLKTSTEPRSLNRFQQLNAVKISGMPMMPLDGALKKMEGYAQEILPAGYSIDYTGESRQLRVEGSKFLPSLGLAVVLIFLVLAAQFNSFRDPLVILLGSVPLAMFGALIFTFLKFPNPQMPYWTDGWTTTLNIYSQVGLVTLVGLVSKNGILIVEFANEMQRQGMNKLEAVRAASLTRLRPVLMTTVATVAGHFPLTLVTGAGAEARNSIGIVLCSGMAIGTIFTLLVVPSLYVLMAKTHENESPHHTDELPEGFDEETRNVPASEKDLVTAGV
jgi:multidrug efflux pump